MDILLAMDWTNVAEIGAGILLAALVIACLYAIVGVLVYVTH